MADFPYTEKHFHIEGTNYTCEDDLRLHREEKILEERKIKAENVKQQVEEYMNGIPLRMQRIIRYKYFENMLWEEVAAKMGKNCSADSVRMEYKRFLEE